MPFDTIALQNSDTISNHRINPLSSAGTSPEMRLWDQVKTFFDSTRESDAEACIRDIYCPPATTTREAVANRFEQLRTLTYPGYQENIQSARHGENHFCILGENGQEILSVTLGDTETYEVEYEGRRIRHAFIQSPQEHEAETENTAEVSVIAPLTAEECEAIWTEWECAEEREEKEKKLEAKGYCDSDCDSNCSVSTASSYTKELIDRGEVVQILRDCLTNNDPELTLSNLYSLYYFPVVFPPHITELTIDNIGPIPLQLQLPPGLQTLSLSSISLEGATLLPQGLRTLMLSKLNITELPKLPDGLKTLYIYNTQLTRLPTLPDGLQTLHIYDTQLTRLPTLPNELQTLKIEYTPLVELPALPNKLTELVINDVAMRSLPELPLALQNLVISSISLPHLPPLPLTLQNLNLRNLPLTHLPPLPLTLLNLYINHIPLISGLEDVVNLSSATDVSLTCATMSERMIQTLRRLTHEPGYSGPRIYFNMAGSSLPREARILHQAVAAWLTPPEETIVTSADKWKAFEQENHVSSFSLFLDRLSDTKNFRQHSEFQAQVSSWLTQLAEDDELRAKTFAMATESTSSCEDRVTLAMNQMKCVQLLHQAEKGLFDEHIPELVAAGREMFRLEQLEQIAREKTATLKLVDEIEVWLGYQNQLKEPLGLASVTAEMNYFDVSGITQSDLQAAESRVKAAENRQFTTWILQWTPLHSLLQRTASEHWAALSEKKKTDYEEQYQALSDTELKPAGLVGDSEAERTIGTRAMASAEKAFLEGLRVLTEQKLGRHLQEAWL